MGRTASRKASSNLTHNPEPPSPSELPVWESLSSRERKLVQAVIRIRPELTLTEAVKILRASGI